MTFFLFFSLADKGGGDKGVGLLIVFENDRFLLRFQSFFKNDRFVFGKNDRFKKRPTRFKLLEKNIDRF